MRQINLTVVQSIIDFTEINFAVTHPHDAIQKTHMQGEFYEMEELEIIRRHSNTNGRVFLDIGSNVGNHALFVEKFLSYDTVVVIEPNPESVATLILNMKLNSTKKVDMRFLGVGLSDTEAKARVVADEIWGDNLGGASLSADRKGNIKILKGDTLFSSMPIDFIKIDVEGMELGVLKGLSETITRWSPKIFIEVKEENDKSFRQWVFHMNYKIECSYNRYEKLTNYMLIPL